MQKLVLLSVVSFLAFSLVAAVAQETDNPPDEERVVIETKAKDAPNKGLTLEREVRPRLPNYYASVVDSTQREAIYTLQRQYNELIAFLELRVELLKKERDGKIEAVLTPAQLERVRASVPARRTILPR